MLETLEHETGPAPEWTVLWLHGLGADGHDFAPIVPELVRPDWPAVRFVFPHAPVQPITINNGMPMRAWYDLVSLSFDKRADSAGVARSVQLLDELIEREIARGIAPARILLFGFSQGGAVILSAGLGRTVPLGGLAALSTYLPEPAAAAQQLVAGANAQPLFMAHGGSDPVIPLHIAAAARDTLAQLGFQPEWHEYPMAHQVCAQEIHDLSAWMSQRFAGG